MQGEKGGELARPEEFNEKQSLRTARLDRCVDNCLEVHRLCLSLITSHIQTGGVNAEPGSLTRLIDCAEICQMTGSFVARNSELHLTVRRACVEVCLQCADYCQGFEYDERAQTCAAACRRCAESCLTIDS